MAKEFYDKDYYEQHIVEKPKRNSFKDLQGLKINKITVVNYAGIIKSRSFWWCICSCSEDKYFRVNASSLKKGITSSCGCNYKHNGNNVVHDIQEATRVLNKNLSFTKFNGWNYPCTIHCSSCGVLTDFNKANNARGFTCCRQLHFETISQNLEKYNYSYIGKGIAVCDSCNKEQKLQWIRSTCRCNYTGGISNNYSSVYVLQDETKTYIKIGKSINPVLRHRSINKSSSNSKENIKFNLVRVLWTYNEKLSYWLESYLHQYFKENRVSDLDKFDGSTEVFTTGISSIDKWINENDALLSNLLDKDYKPILHNKVTYPQTLIDYSIEIRGEWFPSKKYYSNHFDIPYEWVDESLTFTSMKWFKLWKPLKSSYDAIKRSEVKYGVDWGDGYFGTIKGLANKYNRLDGTIFHRVKYQKMSMREALLPPDNIDMYWLLNNKYYRKTHICAMVGLPKNAVTNRVRRGIPLIYALIPERWKKTNVKYSIYILDGDAYWWADLSYIFGNTKSRGYILNKYTTVENWLLQEDLLRENDNFLEIIF